MIIKKTVILKLKNPDKELEVTIQKYTDGMNYVSGIVFRNGKNIAVRPLQKLTYKTLRSEYGLKSQMACNIIRQVCGTYSSLKQQIRKKKTKWKQIVYRPTNMTFSYRRDFTIKRGQISITTMNGRNRYDIANYDHADQYFNRTWKYCASKLVIHRDNSHYFHLSIEKEVDNHKISETTDIIGIDVGINHLAVATTTDKKNIFLCGGELKNIRNTYSGQRKRLQSKGTRSSKRMLKHLRLRETRLMTDTNHVISKKVVAFVKEHKIPLISMEDLTGIRDNTKVRREQRYKHTSWAFRQLQDFIEYKAGEQGISVVYIDPHYTSQSCSRCGHIEKSNRQGRNFKCKVCAFALNSDLNASRNIEHKARDFRHDLESQGCVVDHPDGNSRPIVEPTEFQATS